MDSKILIIDLIVPSGIPPEADLHGDGWRNKNMIINSGEGTQWKAQLRDGAPDHFHGACARLLQFVSGKVHSVLVGGPIGEGIGFGPRQYETLLTAMKKVCPPDICIMAGLLGRDDMIPDQFRIANNLGINNFVLGINHRGDNKRRFNDTTRMFGNDDRLWLCSMPNREPECPEFIEECMEDLRVQGIIDSSRSTDALRLHKLLQLKDRRPDFQILVGNEKMYGDLGEEEFAKIDGLVSGISITDPDLLFQFAQDPKAGDVAQKREELHESVVGCTYRRQSNPVEIREALIHGLKLKLRELGIFEPRHVALYSSQLGTLFRTHQG